VIAVPVGAADTCRALKEEVEETVCLLAPESFHAVGQFYKEFGIGTGFGLRFDFSFLVLRLDVGIKAYDPARQPQDRFILNKAKFWKPYAGTDPAGVVNPGSLRDPVIYNVGIGYPF